VVMTAREEAWATSVVSAVFELRHHFREFDWLLRWMSSDGHQF
jgi:hypothetical protein